MAEVIVSGPLFDGRAQMAVKDFVRRARHEIADQGKANVHTLLNMVLRNPTPYYETQLYVERGDPDIVKNHVIVYGPWLEGTGSRNAPKTRFAGYGHWRAATRITQREAAPIAYAVLREYLPRMGG